MAPFPRASCLSGWLRRAARPPPDPAGSPRPRISASARSASPADSSPRAAETRAAADHAHGDRLAVSRPGGLFRGRGRACGRIELPPISPFALVRRRRSRLDPDRRADRLLDGVGVEGEETPAVLFELGEEAGSPIRACLTISAAPPRTFLPAGACPQDVEIDEHESRRIEDAQDVLVAVEVDAVLAADRGVHLGEERRGANPKAQAAHEDRGGEARDVASDAAAHARDERRAVGSDSSSCRRISRRSRGSWPPRRSWSSIQCQPARVAG